MNKLVFAVSFVLLGAFSIGVLMSAGYVLFSMISPTPEFAKYYGSDAFQALARFIVDPMEGRNFNNDDIYIRNVIFGGAALVMGALVYRRL